MVLDQLQVKGRCGCFGVGPEKNTYSQGAEKYEVGADQPVPLKQPKLSIYFSQGLPGSPPKASQRRVFFSRTSDFCATSDL